MAACVSILTALFCFFLPKLRATGAAVFVAVGADFSDVKINRTKTSALIAGKILVQ